MAENPSPEPTPAAVPQTRPLLREAATEGRPPFNEVSLLFPLLTLYTVGYLALMLVDFLLKQALDLPEGIMPVYIALLGAYAADKEIRRWLGTPELPRKGSVFVYLWMLFFLVTYIIRTFQPAYPLPVNLAPVCLQVLGIFFGSKASKYIWQSRSQPEEPAVVSGRQDQVMEMLKTRDRITNRDVAELFQISDTTAKRLLTGMVEQGLIRRRGEKKGTFYISASEASGPAPSGTS